DASTFSGFNSNGVSGGTFNGTANLNFPYVWTAGPGTTINSINDYNNSCSTYCHGGWAGNSGNGSQQEPIWIGGSVEVACGTCHYATGATPPQSGSHLKHAATTGAGLAIPCGKCHATYSTYTGSAHINGKVQWDLSTLAGGTGGAKYNGTVSGATAELAGNTTYGQCSNLYCHSNIQSTDGTGAPTYWATPT